MEERRRWSDVEKFDFEQEQILFQRHRLRGRNALRPGWRRICKRWVQRTWCANLHDDGWGTFSFGAHGKFDRDGVLYDCASSFEIRALGRWNGRAGEPNRAGVLAAFNGRRRIVRQRKQWDCRASHH